jgi:hypothetical protein
VNTSSRKTNIAIPTPLNETVQKLAVFSGLVIVNVLIFTKMTAELTRRKMLRKTQSNFIANDPSNNTAIILL